MKKFYNIIVFLAIVAFIFGIKHLSIVKTNPIDESVNYQDELFKEASLYSLDYSEVEKLDSIVIQNIDPSNIELYGYDYEYVLNYENESIQSLGFPGFPYDNALTKYNLDDLEYFKFTKSQERIIQKSKKRISKLVDDYSIFSNKDFLKQGIENIEFYLVRHPELFKTDYSADLIAVYYEGSIYVNKDSSKKFCEHSASHELVHHLRHLTNYGDDYYNIDPVYSGLLFDEVMTEVLTVSSNPYLPKNLNGYLSYTYNAYRYLDIFKEDALKAYFYGYDDFFEKYGNENFLMEHDAFVSSFTGYSSEYYDLMNVLSIEILNKIKPNSYN